MSTSDYTTQELLTTGDVDMMITLAVEDGSVSLEEGLTLMNELYSGETFVLSEETWS